MSKLSDKLSQLGRAAPARIGFGQMSVGDRTPVILMIGVGDAGAASAASVDAVLQPAKADGRPSITSPGKNSELWGSALTDVSAEDLDSLKDAGGDFLLIESDDAPGIALRDDDLARGYVVPDGLSEEQARAVEDAHFDFLVLRQSGISWPLTVGAALALQERVSTYSGHIFLQIDSLPTVDDLQLLRDLPVSVLMIDLASVDASRLKKLREAIAELEPRKERTNTTALIPGAAGRDADLDDFDNGDDWDDEEA